MKKIFHWAPAFAGMTTPHVVGSMFSSLHHNLICNFSFQNGVSGESKNRDSQPLALALANAP
jgi:hypothetical protein